jgi:hypothetical protein
VAKGWGLLGENDFTGGKNPSGDLGERQVFVHEKTAPNKKRTSPCGVMRSLLHGLAQRFTNGAVDWLFS